MNKELSPTDWLAFVRREYLEDFIPSGGCAVKFVVPYPPYDAHTVHEGLRMAAESSGFQFALVDSAATRIHLMDRLVHDVARQIDWSTLPYTYLYRLLSDESYRVPEFGMPLELPELARLNQREETPLRQDLLRLIEQRLFHDYEMNQEFRLAMIGLCRAQLEPKDDQISGTIRDWLVGNPVRLPTLKAALIYQRIARHNARHILASLSHWLRLAGKYGLVIVLDISRYPLNVRVPDRGTENSYSTSAALDAYEVLRQLIDGSDDMESVFLAVVAGPAFLTDEQRGVRRYPALELRIADDVHDAMLVNPFASLVRFQQLARIDQSAGGSP